MKAIFLYIIILYCFCSKTSAQQPEINDQFETTKPSDEDMSIDDTPTTKTLINSTTAIANNPRPLEYANAQRIFKRIYEQISLPIEKIVGAPKVKNVIRNVGTCIVNGFMELVTYYFPAPFIPLIASAAGFVIPFEPVVMLRRRMPVTSYRRAIKTAVNSFLNTFDGYKNEDDDPYMTRKFYRRLLNEDPKEKQI